MKKIIIISIFTTAIFITVGCKKEITYLAAPVYLSDGDAGLKINYLSAYTANPAVQLSLNGQRVSGLVVGRTPFPGGGYNTNGSNFPDYLVVTPGSNTLKISIPNKNTNTDSITLFTTTYNIDAKKNYTIHVSDTLTNTKSVLVEDNIIIPPALNTCVYTFVNMMPNVPKVDLYYNTTLMATGISYLTSTNRFTLPVQTVAGTWAIRETGTAATSTALATYSNLNTSINERIYTAFASGYKGSTGTRLPYISFLLNK